MSDMTSTCWTAIRGAAAGDSAERDRFARRYAPIIISYLQARWRDPLRRNDVDDAVQEVFMECFRSGGALTRVDPDADGGFRGFLYGITRNVAMRVESRRAKHPEVALETSSMGPGTPADSEDLAHVFDRAWARSLVQQAWDTQESIARSEGEAAIKRVELLRLRFDGGMPIRDIAARWSVDADFLHEEYAKARREFHAALRQVVMFHMPGSRGDIDKECRRLLETLQSS